MQAIARDERIKDLVQKHEFLRDVLSRFNIDQGLYGLSIVDACNVVGLNADFLLTVLSAYGNLNAFPEKELRTFPVTTMLDFLQKTHQYYRYRRIPEGEKYIFDMIRESMNPDSRLDEVNRRFTEVKDEILEHIEEEEASLFPYILYLYNIGYNEYNLVELYELMEKNTISTFAAEHDDIERQLGDVLQILKNCDDKVHSLPSYAKTVRHLEGLIKDLTIHKWVEERVLTPAAMEIEANIRKEIY
ncbi:MAG: hemerythrin domain-containing protein [Flavobacteriales bacterium]|nr:hemerythrin domain-containing protein [Flavobacteriales bacterium]MCB9446812.1 hemerythrin domain-containing protein [Flavobacteriales bacterium]